MSSATHKTAPCIFSRWANTVQDEIKAPTQNIRMPKSEKPLDNKGTVKSVKTNFKNSVVT